MKIAIIAHLKFPIVEPFHGGLEMHTHILTKRLMARGHDVTLYALADSDPEFKVKQPQLSVIRMGLGNDLFEGEADFNNRFVDKMHAYMDIMRMVSEGGYDVVHNNSLHFIPLAMAHTLPCPMVTALHTPPFPSLQSGAILAKSYLGNHFVAVSESLGRGWKDFVNRYEVIYNGVNARAWSFSESPKPKTAVWIGRFCPEKGPEYAIEAARLAGYHLKMAGSIYDQAYFDQKIAPRLGPDVEVVGHLDHNGLCELIGESEVGLFTSTWEEPFGLVLTEMLACGTPIVSFDSGAAREIICDDCGVIVPMRDYVAMAQAIPQAAALRREDCRLRSTDHFPIEKMIEEYENLYVKLSKTSARATASSSAVYVA
ncbi:glycosyltransferase [Lewinella sp. 4G2]|uniref:glycosyltransferase n=1 Tax=Lewinella sp. 4G2 TaxID=1803372 RepID=UPI0007B4F27C|nr:glycosyltransferase [Lewinella sp. 4G2]OAV44166.1 hypothetical protein A3850_006495 [Lewinella sp. 4G2]